MRRLALLVFLALAVAAAPWPSPARADGGVVSAGDAEAIRDVITRQVDAFRRDAAAEAFGYASPRIRAQFGTPENFMAMVRAGYPQVYRPRLFRFRDMVELDGAPAQRVDVEGPDREPVIAVYPMRRLSDGRWAIDGCFLVPAPGQGI